MVSGDRTDPIVLPATLPLGTQSNPIIVPELKPRSKSPSPLHRQEKELSKSERSTMRGRVVLWWIVLPVLVCALVLCAAQPLHARRHMGVVDFFVFLKHALFR